MLNAENHFSPWTSVKPFFVKLSKNCFNAVKHNYKRRKIYLKWSWPSWSLLENMIKKNRVNIVTFWTYLLSRIIIGKFTQPLYDDHIKCRIYRCVLLKLWNFSSGKCDQWLIIQSLISGPTHLFHGCVSPGSMWVVIMRVSIISYLSHCYLNAFILSISPQNIYWMIL